MMPSPSPPAAWLFLASLAATAARDLCSSRTFHGAKSSLAMMALAIMAPRPPRAAAGRRRHICCCSCCCIVPPVKMPPFKVPTRPKRTQNATVQSANQAKTDSKCHRSKCQPGQKRTQNATVQSANQAKTDSNPNFTILALAVVVLEASINEFKFEMTDYW
uniref:Secreted protein n=1 Tax=Globodera rostochiensis TaxID=31243 RepID=A0A914IAV8_GLORO